MNTGIYKITCGSTYYYGQAQDLKKREWTHRSYLREGQHHNRHLQNAYNKYEEFTFEVVLYCETSELDRYEQWFLDTYQSLEKCANIAKDATAPTRGLKMPHSTEHKAKLSAAKKGKKLSAETKAKIGAASLGRKHTAKTKARLSAALKGKKRPEGVRAKLATANRSRVPDVVVTFNDGTTRAWPTKAEVAKGLGVSASTVGKWIAGVARPHIKHNIKSITTHESKKKQITAGSDSI